MSGKVLQGVDCGRFVEMAAAFQGMTHNFPEPRGKSDLIGGRDVLVREHQHKMFEECTMHLGKQRIVHRCRSQIDADEFGAQRAELRLNLGDGVM